MGMDLTKSDLSIFPNEQLEIDINKPNFKYHDGLSVFGEENGKLNLFSNSKDLPDQQQQVGNDFDESLVDKESFCQDLCSQKVSQKLEENKIQLICNQSARIELTHEKNSTPEVEEANTKNYLNSEGFLFYYRQFVYRFLEHIDHEELVGENFNLNINLVLTKYEIDKLTQFSSSSNDSSASGVIQEATDILKNMFNHIEHFKPEEFAESFSKTVISIALDPRVQIALFFVIIVLIMSSILFNQICRHKFSLKSLIITLLVLVFIISTINNHFLIIQKNEILKNQKLKEKIPDECFGSVNSPNKENDQKNKNIFSNAMSHFKNYFRVKPTSQVCLEFQEALLLDNKHANFIETIIFTITESIRPISVLLGESINLFYSSLTKNLSFYQYMPLMGVVTVILVPLLVYMMSLLSLILFGYEFNFFHLISLKKSDKGAELAQQEEFLKALSLLRKENEMITASLTGSRPNFENLKSLTISNNSDSTDFDSKPQPIEDSCYTEKKPDSYYNDHELDDNDNHNTSLNESLTEEVDKFVKNRNKRETKLLENIEELQYENKKLKELFFYRKEESTDEIQASIEVCSESTSTLEPPRVPTLTNCVSIGLSKTIKKNAMAKLMKNSYVKDISDNDFGDDDEDIVVILDEK